MNDHVYDCLFGAGTQYGCLRGQQEKNTLLSYMKKQAGL